MSLRRFFFKTKFTYKIYLYYNLYIRHKGFQKREKYSQWGEDLEIIDFFQEKKNGTYLDIGCFHPFLLSNTYLLYKKGWQGINIDMNPTSIDLFKIARPKDLNICSAISSEPKELKMYYDDPFSPLNTVDEKYYEMSKHIYFKNKKIIKVQSQKFDNIIYDQNIKKIDFINIDVEGLDLEILKQIDLKKFGVSLVAIETHHVDGTKSKSCDKIFSYLENLNFLIHRRVGPTSLFRLN